MLWKNISGFENYEISDTGIIKSKDKLLKFGNNGNGYLFVHLSKNGSVNRFYVHRLVASTFIPNPENKGIVNHKDGNKSNNCVSNLEWCSQKENIQHARKTGLVKITEETRKKISSSKKGKLNPHHRCVICVETGMIFDTIKQASDYLGFHKTAVSNAILKKRTSGGYHFKYYDS